MRRDPNEPQIDKLIANTLPLKECDRAWGFGDLTWVQSGLAIGTWSFLIGAVTAAYVGFWDGLWAMLLGNCIGVIPMLFATALPANKWGTEHYVAQRAIFGHLGVLLTIITMSLVAIGWMTILAVMFGESAAKILATLSVIDRPATQILTTTVALIATFAGWWVVAKGDETIARLNRYVAPVLIAMSIGLILAVFSRHSLVQVAAAPALTPRSSHASNIMLAVELNIAAGMSWWSLAANVSRPAKTQRIALWAGFLGYVPVAVLAQAVGLIAALVMGSTDPTDWILPIVGPVGGVAVLILIGFANVTSLSGVAYASLQTLVQHFGPPVQKQGWARTSGALFSLCAICILATGALFYQKFFAFVAYTQAILAPAIGITLADYYLLRQTRFSLEDLYNFEASGRYFFWYRINYFALLSLAAGATVYLLIINPSTLSSTKIFDYTTASLPALMVSLLTHVVLTRFIVKRFGKGGYVPR